MHIWMQQVPKFCEDCISCLLLCAVPPHGDPARIRHPLSLRSSSYSRMDQFPELSDGVQSRSHTQPRWWDNNSVIQNPSASSLLSHRSLTLPVFLLSFQAKFLTQDQINGKNQTRHTFLPLPNECWRKKCFQSADGFSSFQEIISLSQPLWLFNQTAEFTVSLPRDRGALVPVQAEHIHVVIRGLTSWTCWCD